MPKKVRAIKDCTFVFGEKAKITVIINTKQVWYLEGIENGIATLQKDYITIQITEEDYNKYFQIVTKIRKSKYE